MTAREGTAPGQAARRGKPIDYEPEIPVRLVRLWLCDLCLDGEGDECHTPGCSLWIHDVPKPAIRNSQGVTILGNATEPFAAAAAAQPAPDPLTLHVAHAEFHEWMAAEGYDFDDDSYQAEAFAAGFARSDALRAAYAPAAPAAAPGLAAENASLRAGLDEITRLAVDSAREPEASTARRIRKARGMGS